MGVLRKRRWTFQPTIVVSTAVVLAGLVGCASQPTEIDWPDDPPSVSPDTARSQATLDSAEAEAADQILALVNDFREAEAAIYSDPQPPDLARRDLSAYLADPLLTETLINLNGMYEAGIVFEGRQTWQATVVDVRLDETPPTAAVEDCVDASSWTSVFRETGDPVPGDPRPDRYLAKLELKLYTDGWLVHDLDIEEAPC